jgi:hypothetical protein
MLNDKISSIIVTWKTPDILALENAIYSTIHKHCPQDDKNMLLFCAATWTPHTLHWS